MLYLRLRFELVDPDGPAAQFLSYCLEANVRIRPCGSQAGADRHGLGLNEMTEDLAGDEALQTVDDLRLALALGGATPDTFLGGRVPGG